MVSSILFLLGEKSFKVTTVSQGRGDVEIHVMKLSSFEILLELFVHWILGFNFGCLDVDDLRGGFQFPVGVITCSLLIP